jgi:hypothetical protein
LNEQIIRQGGTLAGLAQSKILLLLAALDLYGRLIA